jgi:SAM-dependent methyltransferase
VSGSFIDKFSQASGLYRQARPHYPEALFEELARLAPVRGRAWDCGTGNGQAAVGLARHFAEVYATDRSPQQIAQAERADRVTYSVEPAEAVSLPDRSVDLVTAAQAMHWFDLPRFYTEVKRVLKPGGILAAFGYAWFHLDPEIDAAVEAVLLKPLRPYWAPNNAILWDGYRGIPFPGEEIRIGQPAIHLSWSLDQFWDYVRTWSALKALEAAEGEGPLLRARGALEEAWGDAGRKRHVVMPMLVRVARIG